MWVFTGKELINIASAIRITLAESGLEEKKYITFRVLVFFSSDDMIQLTDVYLDCSKLAGVDASNYKGNPYVTAGKKAGLDECMKCIQALNTGLRDGLSYCDISEAFYNSIFLQSDGTMRLKSIY